jgi:phospholipid/cholesterol/gamma-HCH transport system substrate-binding protein
VATRRLFEELNRDRPMLERFVVEQANLMTTISERREDLSGLIDNLADMMGAIANERGALGEAIPRLPTFMRRANTTFVNLRATLDDLDPLVEESKPVAPKLRRYLQELRPFAEDARPTFRDLSAVTRSPGPDNDLLDLSRSTLPFRDIAVGPVQANGAEREGALPAAAKSLREQAPHMAFSRPYAVDLTQWFDDFSHSGIYDANGSASRIATTVNAFATVGGVLTPVAPALRNEVFERSTTTGQNNRCPGAMERDQGNDGIPFRPSPDFNCDPSQRPTGP